jgi:hypothetical protein
MNLFTPLVAEEKLHPNFRIIRDAKKNRATRLVMQEIFDRLPKPDNNFVLDFQTTGFDARVWELYLAGVFQSLGMEISQPEERPDFLLTKNGGKIWVEATTANPTQGTNLTTGENHWAEQDRIGLKLGSALHSKLQKRYWDLPHVAGLPLAFAIADFHDPHPVRSTSSALGRYLYGLHVTLLSDPEERGWEYEVKDLAELRFGAKAVPAGYFFQPQTENVSCVIFSNAGTVPKFTRMGLQQGLDEDTIALRYGLSYGEEIDRIVPQAFYYLVGDRIEVWEEEVHVYHNPNARYPLADGTFGGAIDIRFGGGDYYHALKGFHPLSSISLPVHAPKGKKEEVENRLRAKGIQFVAHVKAQEAEITAKIRQIYERSGS